MTPLIFILIALGWAGVVFAWARDRVGTDTGRLPLGAPRPSLRPEGPFAPPRTARMARRRRREVLVALVVGVVCSFLLARAWSALWTVHVLFDVALVAYVWAVLALERPGLVSARPTLTPVRHPEAGERDRPGPRRAAEPILTGSGPAGAAPRWR